MLKQESSGVSPRESPGFIRGGEGQPPPCVTTTSDEKERLRVAARKAEALFPGPIGVHLRTDLESWANCCSLRFDSKGILAQCVDAILAMPHPDLPAAAAVAA